MGIFDPMKYSHSYLVSIQFLGFRFHGWQKQSNAMSLHEMIDKTLSFVFDDVQYKSIGMSRTDSKVSASSYHFQLFLNNSIDDDWFLHVFNNNAPQDLKAREIIQTDLDFNIIQSKKIKEYHYYFSSGSKNHPYAAPFIVNIDGELDIEVMKKGALLFKGEHFFGNYCTKPSKNKVLTREVISCLITENDILKANFFPKKSFVLKVSAEGFLRYQIRLMMGMLIELGKGNISLQDIKESLKESKNTSPLPTIAPGSGLHLFYIEFLK